MVVRRITTLKDRPEGFEFVECVTQNDLRRGVFLLYTDNLSLLLQKHSSILDKLTGIIISPGIETSIEMLGPMLWHQEITDDMLDNLITFSDTFLYLLGIIHVRHKEYRHLQLRWERSRIQQNRLTQFYSAVQKKVRAELNQHSRWTSTALTKLVNFSVEILNSRNLAILPELIVNFLMDDFFDYKLAALYRDREGLELVVSSGELNIRQPFIVDTPTMPIENENILYIPIKLGGKADVLAVNSGRPNYHFSEYEISFLRLFALMTSASYEKRSAEEDLLQAKDRAEKASRAKDHFMANVSHELRTPMNGIMGMLNLLNETELSKGQKQYVDLIKSSTDLLMGIISDILDFSKIYSKTLKLEKIKYNLYEVLKITVSLFREPADSKGLELDLEIESKVPEFIEGDPLRLKQILVNLISNGIKYTSEGSVTLKVQACEKENLKPMLVFTVTDTGIGICEDDKEIIFEAFKQLEYTYTKTHQGVGLGLAIVKSLVKEMNGIIELKSSVNKGSSFIVKIPLLLPESKVQGARKEFSGDSARYRQLGLRVLAAEDDFINMMYLSELMKRFGCVCDSAMNGLEAIQKLSEKNYDLILLDIGMPQMDGLECVKCIRELEKEMGSSVPVIALTGYVMDEDREKINDAGFDGMVPKPILEQQLYKVILDCLDENN